MITPNYDIIYANLLDKIRERISRTPSKSLDDIIADYVNSTGLNLNTERLKNDTLKAIQASHSCSVCGKQGELFKVGDDDVCSGCNNSSDDFRRDVVTQPAPATRIDMASIHLSKFASSLEEVMSVIDKRLEVIADDFEGTSLGDNSESLSSELRRILSGADREFLTFSPRGKDAVPAILQRAFRKYNLNHVFEDAIIGDNAIRDAIANFIGEPETLDEGTSGIDDIGSGAIVDRPDNNDGGIFNAVTEL